MNKSTAPVMYLCSVFFPFFKKSVACFYWLVLSDFFTVGRSVKYLSKSIVEISESCSPPLPRATAEKSRKPGFSLQKLLSQKRKFFLKIFVYIHTGYTFMYIIFKIQSCKFIQSVLFWGRIIRRHTFWTRHTYCAVALYGKGKR
jgi:hypothetical protein